MALQADQRDYKNAFKKHRHAYINWQAAGSDFSKRLILTYCVECGLKYEIMKQENLFQTADAQDPIKSELRSHDLRKLLKRLNKAGMYAFPPIKTNRDETVSPETYHQLCRYCIRLGDNYITAIKQFDSTLENIVKWIEERI